jgi:hypothetical protein
MKYLGKHMNRETFYLEIADDYKDKLPVSNWVCFAIANEKPDDKLLSQFIKASIKNDLYEFKGFGLFGEYLHNSFDMEMVKMEVDEGHSEIEIMTTGSNDTDLANAFWENYGATCLPDRADYDNVKIICVNFDRKDYSDRLSGLLKRFNRKWLPIDENRIMNKENNKLKLELNKNEALVLFDFLSRFNETDKKELFEDQAEERIMWDLEALLEKQLSEAFKPDYKEIIKKARAEVRDEIE